MMEDYQQKFECVLSYIDEHLSQPLKLETLIAIAGLPENHGQGHFLRLFNAMYSIEYFDYINLLRDLQSVFELAYRPNMSMADIASNASFQCAKAFSEDFNARNGITPEAFRLNPEWGAWFEKQKPLDKMREPSLAWSGPEYEVSLANLAAIELAVFEHRGRVSELYNSQQIFSSWRRVLHTPPSLSRTFELVYHDNGHVPACEYRLDIGAEISRPLTVQDAGIVSKQLPKGRYALLAHKGDVNSLQVAIKYLYSQWLLKSGEPLADFPLVLERVTPFCEATQHKAITYIYLGLNT
ncbi:GyrI-like domain-containing protein [Shewanella sp. SR44-3]|uniref:AraC family transcriptional regulator n=1 Tax=unclassified Shewanella TaxID=196818 RepID=UPI0015F8E478|nr:GyrI-like domain-containing protein [Shewanella sp. SR44-3]MBB1270980.1 AraC family transcriptional regulator [Shewanella sp. SR44-3]